MPRLATIPAMSTAGQTLLIIALVYMGRGVEPYLRLLIDPLQDFASRHLHLLIIAGGAFVLAYYRILLQTRVFKSIASIAAHAGLGAALGGLAVASTPLIVESMHLILYGTLAFFARLALREGSGNFPAAATLIFSQLVSLLDESLQGLHPARFFDMRDLFFNFLGAFGALCVIEPLLRLPTNAVKNCTALVEDPRR